MSAPNSGSASGTTDSEAPAPGFAPLLLAPLSPSELLESAAAANSGCRKAGAAGGGAGRSSESSERLREAEPLASAASELRDGMEMRVLS